MSIRELPAVAATPDDGTDAADFTVYLRTLKEYHAAALRETPFEYLARLEKLLGEAERVLPSLQACAALTEDAFASLYADWDRQVRILGEYLIAVRSIIESLKWLSARERLARRPRSHAHALELLCRAGVLPAERLPALVRMIRSRNAFIHCMGNPTAGEMYRYLGDTLEGIATLAALLRDRYLSDAATDA